MPQSCLQMNMRGGILSVGPALTAANSRMMKCRNRASRFESYGRRRFGSDLVRKASSRGGVNPALPLVPPEAESTATTTR